jgi:RHS repeat-associated protein
LSFSTEILYGPGGVKLALMNGTTVVKVFAPLPGGATAVYTSSGLAYYRHPDWLGSSRLASTPSRAVYYDGAYAPFGEPYDETGTTDRNFTGQNQDMASDLYDFLYREYHPTQGRWIQPDPAGLNVIDSTNPQTWNRYAYAANKPLESLDPNGPCSQAIDGSFNDDDDHDFFWFPGPCSGGQIGEDGTNSQVTTQLTPIPTVDADGNYSDNGGISGTGSKQCRQ